MEDGNQRLVVRLKKRTSFKTHNSSGFVESDWRAIPPKTIKLLFPVVLKRGKGQHEMTGKLEGRVWNLQASVL